MLFNFSLCMNIMLFNKINDAQIGLQRGNVGTWLLQAHISIGIRDELGGLVSTTATAIAKLIHLLLLLNRLR